MFFLLNVFKSEVIEYLQLLTVIMQFIWSNFYVQLHVITVLNTSNFVVIVLLNSILISSVDKIDIKMHKKWKVRRQIITFLIFY